MRETDDRLQDPGAASSPTGTTSCIYAGVIAFEKELRISGLALPQGEETQRTWQVRSVGDSPDEDALEALEPKVGRDVRSIECPLGTEGLSLFLDAPPPWMGVYLSKCGGSVFFFWKILRSREAETGEWGCQVSESSQAFSSIGLYNQP